MSSNNSREKGKTLLQKYDIPINHLDFVYIGKCTNARELERIVEILRSGEEGYFPDLTTCAENKLRELKPESKAFRCEQPINDRSCLKTSEWKPFYDWTDKIKGKDHEIDASKDNINNDDGAKLDLQPIRKCGSISQNKSESSNTNKKTQETAKPSSSNCIKATDYRKWDLYDADEEVLRMDLTEERALENVERKNRLNLQKSAPTQKIFELEATGHSEDQNVFKLTDVEREHLIEELRYRGNEFFRIKEYENAIAEYTKAIELKPDAAAPAYNNRAAANIKLQKYSEAIADCTECLKLEPQNIKAKVRLAEATYGYGKRYESYELFQNVIELDANNAVALKAIKALQNELKDLPPSNATRLMIKEEKPTATKKQILNTAPPCSKLISPQTNTPETNPQLANAPIGDVKPVEYDLPNLVMPNSVVKTKLGNIADVFGALQASGIQK